MTDGGKLIICSDDILKTKALKLKEISYLHAEGYPAGEMKHGPIALADPELFTIALMPKNMLYDKIKSNVEKLSARDSTICAISSADFELADDFIKIKVKDKSSVKFTVLKNKEKIIEEFKKKYPEFILSIF